MKVVIGNKIYDSQIEPIVIRFSEKDKQIISNMPSDKFILCVSPKDTKEAVINRYTNLVGGAKLKK